MFCNKCGASCADDAKFCINCGNELPVKKIIPLNEETVEDTVADSVSEPVGEEILTESTKENAEFVSEPVEEKEENASQVVPPIQEQNNYNNSGNYDAHYQPPQYPQGYYPPVMPDDPYKGKAKAGMICGIISLVLCVISCCVGSPATLILSIFGIVYSGMSVNKTTTFKNQAIAGLTCSIIALVLSLCAIVFYIFAISAYRSNPEIFNEYSQQFSDKFGDTFNTFIRFIF